MRTNHLNRAAIAAILALAFSATSRAQFGPPPAGPPKPAKEAALEDITGYWVSIVTEDWRFRMVTPPKGDYPNIPLNAEGKKIADAWDPAKDEAAGQQCKAFGAAAIMRVPNRTHITWQDDETMKVEIDSGTQTRLFHFKGTPSGDPSFQGYSAAQWLREGRSGGRGGNSGAPGGFMKVVTTRLRPGYLQKNGVPYSANTTVTEYYDLIKEPDGAQWLVVKTIVEDPMYLFRTFITSTHFRKQPDAAGWNPTPCTAR